MSDPHRTSAPENVKIPAQPTAQPPAPAAGWAAPVAPPVAPPVVWSPPGAAPFGPPVGSAVERPVGSIPSAGIAPAPTSAPHSRALGVVALVLSLLATVVTSFIAMIVAMQIVLGTGSDWTSAAMTGIDWTLLTPVRGWVLFGEISFWVGTVLGTWALVQGIVAIVTRRGRGHGIAALVISAVGPIAFGFALQLGFILGLIAGVGDGTIV